MHELGHSAALSILDGTLGSIYVIVIPCSRNYNTERNIQLFWAHPKDSLSICLYMSSFDENTEWPGDKHLQRKGRHLEKRYCQLLLHRTTQIEPSRSKNRRKRAEIMRRLFVSRMQWKYYHTENKSACCGLFRVFRKRQVKTTHEYRDEKHENYHHVPTHATSSFMRTAATSVMVSSMKEISASKPRRDDT